MHNILRFPQRRSIRLSGYDYSSAGAYFVTICTDGTPHLARLRGTRLCLRLAGRVPLSMWRSLPRRFPGVVLDEFVIMPNHLHAVLFLRQDSEAAQATRDASGAGNPALGWLVRTIKAATTTITRKGADPSFSWQRSFYEHVIRSEDALCLIRRYIRHNPLMWSLDRENTAVRPQRATPATDPVVKHGFNDQAAAFGRRHRFVW